MATDIFDFDSCVNQRESNKVRYWGSEGYGGGSRGIPYGKRQGIETRKTGKRGYCPKRNKNKPAIPAKRKKLSIKQLHSVQIGTQLKLFWPPTGTWSFGEVINIYDDGMYELACHDDPADQGPLCYHLADYTFKITHSPEEAEHYDPEASRHEPHPKASRRSSRKPKKRKLFESSTSSRLGKKINKGGVPKMNRDVLVEKEAEMRKEEEVAEEMMKDVLVPMKFPETSHSETNENPDLETPEDPNSEAADGAESKEDDQTGSSVVVSLNRSR